MENYDHSPSPDGDEVQFASKRIKENGSLAFEYAAVGFYQGAEAKIHAAWVIGFLAQLAADIAALARSMPAILPATLRLAFRVDGTILMGVGSGMWASNNRLPAGLFAIPDFTLSDEQDLKSFFQAAQVDLVSLCELEGPAQYSLNQPITKPSEG